ncbi:MAG: hypothetical protein U5K75_02430 [Ahrensia sp.]|nr:hypothetical protein [Ahrensia sp.]
MASVAGVAAVTTAYVKGKSVEREKAIKAELETTIKVQQEAIARLNVQISVAQKAQKRAAQRQIAEAEKLR